MSSKLGNRHGSRIMSRTAANYERANKLSRISWNSKTGNHDGAHTTVITMYGRAGRVIFYGRYQRARNNNIAADEYVVLLLLLLLFTSSVNVGRTSMTRARTDTTTATGEGGTRALPVRRLPHKTET